MSLPAFRRAVPGRIRPGTGRRGPRRPLVALLFALPALVILAALVGYPIVYSVVRSLFDASGARFVGLGNYHALFSDAATRTAIRNTAVWVLVVPALLTGIGLVLAVLTEKVRWATAFKVLIFMPMAVSFLAAGITFRLVYDQDPRHGVLNAVAVGVHDTFTDASAYPGARPHGSSVLRADGHGGYRTTGQVEPGRSAELGLVGIPAATLPPRAVRAPALAARSARPGEVSGVVYLDFVPGGGGRPNTVDLGERGLPGLTVELVRGGKVVARTGSGADGSFRFPDTAPGSYGLRLPASDFTAAYQGVSWLGPGLITPAIMAAYLWIWTGFSMVLIGAGLAALPRETLEAARMDGAGEFQIFRRITAPQLAPVLGVVFVTLVINVLKVFDLVYIIAPGPVLQNANVLALQMWLVSFGGGNDQGLGSAIGIVLLLLVVPAMAFNIRRFRRSAS